MSWLIDLHTQHPNICLWVEVFLVMLPGIIWARLNPDIGYQDINMAEIFNHESR